MLWRLNRMKGIKEREGINNSLEA